jgi:hypothetical protein
MLMLKPGLSVVGLRAVSSPSSELKMTSASTVWSVLFVSTSLEETRSFVMYSGAAKTSRLPPLATPKENELEQSRMSVYQIADALIGEDV